MVRQSQVSDEVDNVGMDSVKFEVTREPTSSRSAVAKSSKKVCVFKQPEIVETMNLMGKKQFAPQSKKKMLWAVTMYNQWRKSRMVVPGVELEIIDANLDLLNSFQPSDICYALCRFIREVRKMDGGEYPPNTIREIIVMIQMFLHENGLYWKLLDGVEFTTLRNVVDNTMKERHVMGLGVRKSSDVISIRHEDVMFQKGILGQESAGQLLRTMVYMIGMHCALRGGAEHNNLRRLGCNSQFKVEFDSR